MWQLIINGPGYFDTAYDLREGVTHVGRADENDIVLSGDLVSRKHARFHVKGDTLSLEDLGSRNGSKLNDTPATGTLPIKAGDVVAVGENSMQVRKVRSAETLDTEMVDIGAGGQVKRFGRGLDIREAVVMARDIRESSVLRALDNVSPFESSDKPAAPKSRPPTDTDETEGVRSLDPLAAQAGVALESLVLLYRVADSLARAKTLQTFLDETTDLVMRRVGATTGVVLLRHRTGVMVPAAVRHSKKLLRGEVPVSDAIIDVALAQGQAIAVADVRDDARFAERESVVVYGIDQVLCIPLGDAPFLGVLYLNRTQGSPEPVEALLDVCTAITQLLQTGIEKFESAPAGSADGRARRALERFFSPEVTERQLAEIKAGTTPLAHVEERLLTVLHLELVGLATAKLGAAVVPLLTEFQKVVTQLVFSFEGAVHHFDGENGVALFGTPASRGDDAIRAVRAAMAVKGEWERLHQRLAPKERLAVRAGLTTGKAQVGTIGGEQRLDLHVIGEAPGLSKLLAASAAPWQILITGKTLAAVGARFDVTPLGERALQGSRVRTAVFEVLDEDNDSSTLSGIR